MQNTPQLQTLLANLKLPNMILDGPRNRDDSSYYKTNLAAIIEDSKPEQERWWENRQEEQMIYYQEKAIPVSQAKQNYLSKMQENC
jgi:hypothetical protein